MNQFNQVKSVINQKWPDAYNIVYFQAFSNTYGSVEKLKDEKRKYKFKK